jgi:hypothetical protein
LVAAEGAFTRGADLTVALCKNDARALAEQAAGLVCDWCLGASRNVPHRSQRRKALVVNKSEWVLMNHNAQIPLVAPQDGIHRVVEVALPPLRAELIGLLVCIAIYSRTLHAFVGAHCWPCTVSLLLRTTNSCRQRQCTPRGPRERKYFTCCVRLSPEKAPHLFVELVEHMADRLRAAGVVPLLIGATGDAAYADDIKVRSVHNLGCRVRYFVHLLPFAQKLHRFFPTSPFHN